MQNKWLERTQLLTGSDALNKLTNANVLIVGLGGVGSFAAEFIARAGVGNLTIIDGDTVDITNINRQLPALHSTVGMGKAALMAARIKDINPHINLQVIDKFQGPGETKTLLQYQKYDYVCDCIDSISPKVYLLKACIESNTPVISSMGAGGKIDALQAKVVDIKKTYNCKFAKLVRKRLHKHQIYTGFKAVFSPEFSNKDSIKLTDGSNYKASFYGTISYIPALFGLVLAGEVIKELGELKIVRQ